MEYIAVFDIPDGYDMGCASCLETVGYYPVGSNDPVELCNFCPNCGKAVKWG